MSEGSGESIADIQAAAPPHSQAERVRGDLFLLAAALVWGSSFVAGRLAAGSLGPFFYNGARFTLGALVLLPFLFRKLRGFTRKEMWAGLLAGVIVCGAVNTQQIGIEFTTAGKAGFITGLYVVFVPLLSALILRRPPRVLVWVATVLATGGLFLLSVQRNFRFGAGDGWVLIAAILFAMHVLLLERFAPRVDVLRLAFVQHLSCGLLSLFLSPFLEHTSLTGLGSGWWTIAYNGALSVGLAFTFQVVGQRHAPAFDAALLMSLESVFAAVFGWLLLSESLSPQQIAGCVLILGAMVIAQIRSSTRSTSDS